MAPRYLAEWLVNINYKISTGFSLLLLLCQGHVTEVLSKLELFSNMAVLVHPLLQKKGCIDRCCLVLTDNKLSMKFNL